MEEDLATPDDSAKNGKGIKTEEKKEGLKDVVFKHFREASDQSAGLLYSDPQESSIEESLSPTKTDRKAFKKSSCKIQQGAVFSGKILSFGCSVCKDDITYSPNDLLKHFRGAHKGTLPTYPCDLCGFVTNEFPALQRHRIGHRNTLVTCEICNDDVQYSLLLLTRHYIMCHSRNGHFHCEKCDFTTVDAGTFVQHIHHHNECRLKCVKCQHVSSSKDEHQKHLKVHAGTFPFTCQICGYGAARSEYLTKHMVHVHGEEMERKSVWRAMEDSNNSPPHSPTGLKLLLKKSPPVGGESKDSQWMSKLNSLPDKNGRMFNSERSLEETQQFVDRMVMKKDSKNWSKSPHNREQQSASQPAPTSTPPTSQEGENSSGSDTAGSNNPNGLTVLMVKNKISLPPNCTTKVMGFKMVDGKKHLVLKVIPTTAKLESSALNLCSVEDLGSAASDSTSDEGKDSVENGEHSSIDGSSSPHTAFSLRSGSCLQTCSLVADQDDIVAVKIKVEEEETTISSLLPILRDDVGENGNDAKDLSSKSSTFADTLHPMEKGSDHAGEKSNQNHSASDNSGKTKLDANSISSSTELTAACDDEDEHTSSPVDSNEVSNVSFPSKSVPESLLLKPIETCGAADQCATTDMVVNFLVDTHKENSSLNSVASQNQSSQNAPEKTDRVGKEIISPSDLEHNMKMLVPRPESPSAASGDDRETDTCAENYSQKSPNQEVFSFHNYSKETFSPSPNASPPFDDSPELSAEDDGFCGKESSQWTLTLAESPQPSTGEGSGDATTAEQSNVRHEDDMEMVPDNDVEVDECVATVEDPPTEDENPESVLQDFNIIKIEEESIPVSEKPLESKSSSASLGRIVEEHSDAIISHQLEKERIGSSTASMDSVRPTKATLRILQIPEGKQQMFLQTAENRYAVPVQLKGNPGFKLITKSSGPQINVSYMKPGFERPSNQTGLALTLNSGRIGMSTTGAEVGEKGATLLSAVQPGVGATTSHYLVNSAGLKGPVLLSSTPHGTPSDKTVKTQPTCYLVQRPLPIVQASSNAGFKLTSTQAPLNSRPVLAMPVNSADKPTTLQPGRQAFLLRYVSAKSGLLLNSSEGKTASQTGQTSESTANKVVFKIVRPPGGLLTSCAATSASQPMFLTTRPQTQCFLLSSNKPNANASTGVKKLIPIQNAAQKSVKLSYLLHPQPNEHLQVKRQEGEKPYLALRPIRPPSQRKRRRKALFDELPEPVQKARRLASKTLSEKETPVLWQPVAKEAERTLRLSPFSSLQHVKCPRRYQPVVVLNHPDADIPEVASIMKSVSRYRGAVTKVSLSRKTVQALSELSQVAARGDGPRPRAAQSSVRERFLLKLKLKKKSKRKYEVVSALSGRTEQPSTFDCWFCGRLFNSQEDWIGHGQRHLMEATRDWNKLF